MEKTVVPLWLWEAIFEEIQHAFASDNPQKTLQHLGLARRFLLTTDGLIRDSLATETKSEESPNADQI